MPKRATTLEDNLHIRRNDTHVYCPCCFLSVGLCCVSMVHSLRCVGSIFPFVFQPTIVVLDDIVIGESVCVCVCEC